MPFTLGHTGRSRTISRHSNAWSRFWPLRLLTILIIFSLFSPITATSTIDRRKGAFEHDILNIPLIYDTSPSPTAIPYPYALEARDYHVSAQDDPSDVTATTTTTTSSAPLVVDTGPSATPSLPTAFDTSLGSNFSSPACPKFIGKMLADPEFVSCVPISLMLQTSTSYFQATKSFARITQVLDVACGASLSRCSALLSGYATQLVAEGTCRTDYDMQNPIVLQAYNGLVAYAPIYAATCLQDTSNSYPSSSSSIAPQPSSTAGATKKRSTTQNYCYAEAVTNANSPTDAYIYYLPLGVALPATSNPSCNPCLQQTLAAFVPYASNASQPISLTYSDAAQLVDLYCGPTFAQKQVKIVDGSAAGLAMPRIRTLVGSVALSAAVAFML